MPRRPPILQVETSQLGGAADADLVLQFTPQGHFNTSNYAVVAIALFTDQGVNQASWNLPGSVTTDRTGSGNIYAVPEGSGIAAVTARGASDTRLSTAKFNVSTPQYLTWAFPAVPGGAVAVSVGDARRSGATVAQLIAGARATELDTYARYGSLAEPAEASQAGMMWNLQVCARRWLPTASCRR